ncbi:MAG: citrate synthase family protein [Anaerolineae bacterium]|nr:citrate synthase family protein [Anaerolineae bacterium]
MPKYLSADEAADLLGISKATLYAYVSRGLVRSERGTAKQRARRYLAEDVRKLVERKAYRRDPAQVAQDALHWGTPVLDSALTLIADGKLYYRGRSALALARTGTIEQVAALLWTGDMAQAGALFGTHPATAAILAQIDPALPPVRRMMAALVLADDLASYDLRPEAVARTGARILALLASAATLHQPEADAGIAAHVRRMWQPGIPGSDRLIDAALILCADHELNVSAFTARIVASAEANPYVVVTAGLAALQGFRHGGNTARVEAYLNEVAAPERVASVTADRLRRGERIPGFGHSLYPNGDPRARVLLALLAETCPDSPDAAFITQAGEQVAAMIGHQPNIDFALVALARVSRLPAGSPLTLFALGRTVGWIGHAIEQYGSGSLIRPRARYVGEPPEA